MPDLEVWRVRKDKRVIRGVVREGANDWDDCTAVELRVEHDGEVYLKERRTDKSEIERRSAELLRDLEAVGWTPCNEKQSN